MIFLVVIKPLARYIGPGKRIGDQDRGMLMKTSPDDEWGYDPLSRGGVKTLRLAVLCKEWQLGASVTLANDLRIARKVKWYCNGIQGWRGSRAVEAKK